MPRRIAHEPRQQVQSVVVSPRCLFPERDDVAEGRSRRCDFTYLPNYPTATRTTRTSPLNNRHFVLSYWLAVTPRLA